MKPHPRRILLAATGLSPQIVTETLYALAVAQPRGHEEEAFVPTEVQIVTTAEGARLARTALLHPDGGQFHALLAHYPQIGRPVFVTDWPQAIKAFYMKLSDDGRTVQAVGLIPITFSLQR